jgi:site-specific recombinase XerD
VHQLLGHSSGAPDGARRVSAERLRQVYEAAHPRAGVSE